MNCKKSPECYQTGILEGLVLVFVDYHPHNSIQKRLIRHNQAPARLTCEVADAAFHIRPIAVSSPDSNLNELLPNSHFLYKFLNRFSFPFSSQPTG